MSDNFYNSADGLTNKNFLSASDNTTQTVAVANTFQAIRFNSNEELEGWTHFVYTASTISFTATNTISDSANGLGDLAIGDFINISGSASNDGLYEVLTTGAGSITVVGAGILTEAAGASITIGSAEFTCNQTGTYRFSFVGQVQKTAGGVAEAEFIGTVGGTQVGKTFVQDLITSNEIKLRTISNIVSFTTGDVLRLEFTANSTSVELVQPTTTGNNPVSAVFSLDRIK